MVLLHVDDKLVGGHEEPKAAFPQDLGRWLKVRSLGRVSLWGGVEFRHEGTKHVLHQTTYVHTLLRDLGLQDLPLVR